MIQKNSLRFFVGTDNVGGLLSSLFYRSYIRYTGPLGQFLELAWIVAISFVILNSSLNSISVLLMREVRQAVKNKIRQLRVF